MRVYTMPITSLTGLTGVPFVQLATPATVGIEILAIELGQETSEVSQQEIITLTRRSTASTLPTSTTPVPLPHNQALSLLTGSTTTNAIGIATVTGTLIDTPLRLPFNVLNGLLWTRPESIIRLTLKPLFFLTLQFLTAPAANTWSGQIHFAELE